LPKKKMDNVVRGGGLGIGKGVRKFAQREVSLGNRSDPKGRTVIENRNRTKESGGTAESRAKGKYGLAGARGRSTWGRLEKRQREDPQGKKKPKKGKIHKRGDWGKSKTGGSKKSRTPKHQVGSPLPTEPFEYPGRSKARKKPIEDGKKVAKDSNTGPAWKYQ